MPRGNRTHLAEGQKPMGAATMVSLDRHEVALVLVNSDRESPYPGRGKLNYLKSACGNLPKAAELTTTLLLLIRGGVAIA